MVRNKAEENPRKAPWLALPKIAQQEKPWLAHLPGEAAQKIIRSFLTYKVWEANTPYKKNHSVESKFRPLKNCSTHLTNQCLYTG